MKKLLLIVTMAVSFLAFACGSLGSGEPSSTRGSSGSAQRKNCSWHDVTIDSVDISIGKTGWETNDGAQVCAYEYTVKTKLSGGFPDEEFSSNSSVSGATNCTSKVALSDAESRVSPKNSIVRKELCI